VVESIPYVTVYNIFIVYYFSNFWFHRFFKNTNIFLTFYSTHVIKKMTKLITFFVLFVVAFVRHTVALNATWRVLAKEFSAITIGIAFENDKIGWTSHTYVRTFDIHL